MPRRKQNWRSQPTSFIVEPVHASFSTPAEAGAKPKLIPPPGILLPFVLLTTCFAAWGLANSMTDPRVKVFSRIFTMSTLQSSLVQFSFYGA